MEVTKTIKKLIRALKKKQKEAVEYTNREYRSPRQNQSAISYWQGYNDAMATSMIAVEHFFETGKCKCKECKTLIKK